jgi:tetratricopeptide (TPR) repeat protein
MNRQLCLFLLLLLPPAGGQAQQKLPVTHPKYKATDRVFQSLINAFASSSGRPALEMLARGSGKRVVAVYTAQPVGKVSVDEELYDLCRQLGPDSTTALAAILGHELAHYYRRHTQSNSFGKAAPGAPADPEALRRIESEADHYSIFYCALAGYPTARAFAAIVDKIYQHYQLPGQLAGYPSLAERKRAYEAISRELAHKLVAFEAGRFLYAVQHYEGAALCFKDLLNDFPSREMHNNLAVCRLQQVLHALPAREHPFRYPVEFDFNTRLSTLTRGERPVEPLLDEAIASLQQAIRMDPGYLPARVNLACAYSLQGNQYLAIGTIHAIARQKLTADAFTMRGIAHYRNDEPRKARADFQQARQLRGLESDYNLAVLDKLTRQRVTPESRRPFAGAGRPAPGGTGGFGPRQRGVHVVPDQYRSLPARQSCFPNRRAVGAPGDQRSRRQRQPPRVRRSYGPAGSPRRAGGGRAHGRRPGHRTAGVRDAVGTAGRPPGRSVGVPAARRCAHVRPRPARGVLVRVPGRAAPVKSGTGKERHR